MSVSALDVLRSSSTNPFAFTKYLNSVQPGITNSFPTGGTGARGSAGANTGPGTSPASFPTGNSGGGTSGSGDYSGPASINIGGKAPTPVDFASAIENDPAFQMLKGTLSAQGISDAASLRSAIQQALIQFGVVPNLPSDVLSNSGLDTGLTSQLASNNPFSVLANLAQRGKDATMAEQNQLAARGILNSGETGYQLGRLGQSQAQAQYDATNSLLGNIGTLNQQYVQGRNAAAQQLAQGAFSAEANAAANNVGGSGSVTAFYDPASGSYVDPYGNRYDQYGNPTGGGGGTPPSSPPPSGNNSVGAPPAGNLPSEYQPGQIGTPGSLYWA
jgi:hypothetical protein